MKRDVSFIEPKELPRPSMTTIQMINGAKWVNHLRRLKLL